MEKEMLPQMPNGWCSYKETLWEMSETLFHHLTNGRLNNYPVIKQRLYNYGHYELMEVAHELTEAFEKAHVDVEWGVEKEWLETLYEWTNDYMNQNYK